MKQLENLNLKLTDGKIKSTEKGDLIDMKEIQLFENEELGLKLRTILIEGEPYFVGKDVAESLGYAKPLNAVATHVDEDDSLKQGLTDSLGRTQQTIVINESGLYSLILSSKLPTAKKFKRWVTSEVLPSIRKNGAYISDKEEDVNEDYIKFAYGRLKKTFLECPIENLEDTYNNCMKFHSNNKTRILYKANSKKRSDATHTVSDSKLLIMQKIINTLEERNNILKEKGMFGLISESDKVIKTIKDDIKLQNNLSSRGKLGAKTRQINNLQKKLDEACPSLSWIDIDYHAFSCNYMFKFDSQFGVIKTDNYNNWINNFPMSRLPYRCDYETYLGIDFNKPIELFINYVCLDKFDVENLNKSFIDLLFNRHFKVDDNIVTKVHSEKVGSCNTYQDGKIYFALRNV